MKYILFLIFIISFNSFLHAEPGMGIQVDIQKSNLGSSYSSEMFKSDPTFLDSQSLERLSLDTISNSYAIKAPSYGYRQDASGTIYGAYNCSAQYPQACKTYSTCRTAGGFWMLLENTCKSVSCHLDTAPEANNPTKCNCLNDRYFSVERGNYLQSCPSSCQLSQHKVYSFETKGCTCAEGYTMSSQGTCNPIPVAAPPPPQVSNCWQELVEKVASCETASTSAVSKCEPGGDDSLRAIQGLLANVNGSAKETCDQVATASTSGFYQVENTRKACDEQLNSCKTSCSEVTTYLNANKERLYNACRDRAFQAEALAGPPLPQDRFNAMWDGQNRSDLDREFQGLITRADTSRGTCETGDAVKNREKLSDGMTEMDTSSKNASRCVCELNPGSSECAKSVVGPADCSANPNLAGCKNVAANCFDPNNVSLKCICVRHPENGECKKLNSTNKNTITLDENSFGPNKVGLDTRNGNGTEASGMASAGKISDAVDTVGKFENLTRDIGGSGVSAPDASGEAAFSSLSNAKSDKTEVGGATAAGGAGLGGGVSARGAAPVAAIGNTTAASVVNRLGGLLDTAKSAIGGILKKGSGGSDSTDYREGGKGGSAFDAKKFRPRGMVRGIASDEVFAGKHEDIWKVMNKQYKVQDQKDNFIFDDMKK